MFKLNFLATFSITLLLFSLLGNLYFYAETDRKAATIEAINADNARLSTERNTLIDVNHSMNKTIDLLTFQLKEARAADSWFNRVEKMMDSKLSNALSDIDALTTTQGGSDETQPRCIDEFSDDVYERMLDVYQQPITQTDTGN